MLFPSSHEVGGTLLGLSESNAIVVNPEGHYRGTPGAQHQIVCLTQTKDGTRIVAPGDFANRFGWKNDPERVRLSSK